MKRLLLSTVAAGLASLLVLSLSLQEIQAGCHSRKGSGCQRGGTGGPYSRSQYSKARQPYRQPPKAARSYAAQPAPKPKAAAPKVQPAPEQPEQPGSHASEVMHASFDQAQGMPPANKAPDAPRAATAASPGDEPAAEAANRPFDLELVDVALADRGSAAERQGPKYRIRVRNLGSDAAGRAFSVALLLAASSREAQLSPPVVERVSGIDGGQTLAVDIRVPFETHQIAQLGPQQPKLFVVIDSQQELAETDELNNVAELDPAELKAVAPSVVEVGDLGPSS